MANKQYISIIRLLDNCDIYPDETLNISRIKKQLTAEFGFAASGIIEVDGFSYNKNDVFEEIEKSDFIQRLVLHQRIWECKSILCFLEENALNFHDFKDQIKQFHNDREFDNFFSPYFAIPFNAVARNYLNEGRLDEVGDLLLFESFVQDADREEALRSIRIFLDENIRLIKNTNKDNYKTIKPKIAHWVAPYWARFVNNLPHEFYKERRDIAFYLVNLTVAIQKTNKKDCKVISRELTCIVDLPEDLANVIHNNDRIYESNGSGSRNYGWLIWVAIILVRILSGC